MKEIVERLSNGVDSAFKQSKSPSLQMCPFCALITARDKPCCLECGRELKPA
jgi:hypothetical protein